MNYNNRKYYDIINEEAICSFSWTKDTNTYQCNPKDSIEFQFHLPVFSVYDKKERKIYSNPIKVSYCTIINTLEEDMKSHDFDYSEYRDYQFEYLSFQKNK